jgi:iron(III) transport system substrate-binding protein
MSMKPTIQGRLALSVVSLGLGLGLSLAHQSINAQEMPGWEKALYEAAKKEKEFTVYTAHYSTQGAANLCAAFDKKYPGVKCNFVRTTAQVAYQRYQQELKANKPVVSVLSSTDVGHYPPLKAQGQLMAYKPNNLGNMVDALKVYNDPDGHWLVTSAGLVVITYNNSLVAEKDAPKKWTDLLDPKWKEKLAIGHPAFSGYVGTWVVAMDKTYGWSYFDRLEKNRPQIGRSINDTVTMLNAKERWVAAGPDATTLQSQDKGNPVGVIYPEDGSLLMVSMTGIPKNAPSPNAAKLFIEFLLSKEAAEVQVKDRAQSVIKGVRPLPGGKSMDEIKLLRPSEDEIAKGIPAVKEKFRDTFGI